MGSVLATSMGFGRQNTDSTRQMQTGVIDKFDDLLKINRQLTENLLHLDKLFMNPSRLSDFSQALQISRSDRWQVCHRLNELDIVATCSTNGSLSVEIRRPIDLLQVRSVLQQLTASRQQLIELLERCWA